MIIEETATCNNYAEKIQMGFHGGEVSRGIYTCTNPDCRCSKFYRHESYERWIVPLDELPDISSDFTTWVDDIFASAFRIKILRVICAACGRTDAILPVDIIPYHFLSLLLTFWLILELFRDTPPDKEPALHQHERLSWPVLKAVVAAYRNYEAGMVAALRHASLYLQGAAPSVRALVNMYAEGHPPSPAYHAFLAYCRKPLFVTRQDTVSSPMRFIFRNIA